MDNQSKLVRVFVGSDITVNLLSAELKAKGISTEIINEYEASNFQGFSTGTPYSVDLYIVDSDLERALPIVSDFIKINGM
ncbi:MAG: DUF2007 domain-containing protein [Lentimicrobium sp.]|jgi:hypothetical protein|nr:DUF2007 domain-containing protein [Lentimicrobium sp.]